MTENDREALAEIVCSYTRTHLYEAFDWQDARLIARAVLEAGYRKPRTITTEAELDALPEGSVIRTSGADEWLPRVAVKTLSMTTTSYWSVADTDEWELTSDELDDLPATVLYSPDGV